MSGETSTAFEGWAILELMGHRRLAGYVREVIVAGAGVLRLDVPADAPGEFAATQYYSPQALYCLTPSSEATCRQLAPSFRPEPVSRWELPPADLAGDAESDL